MLATVFFFYLFSLVAVASAVLVITSGVLVYMGWLPQ